LTFFIRAMMLQFTLIWIAF